ncbi:Hypothetical protein, putative [Bodo saltans]|uniref:Membrane-associated protein n=1 Tax=Bodo saltans TaxID=75058 RepID=A0A0S4JB43_BODSA|nr:Hypothetical protein, putative [Bodo saltans]|eukprot:CUG87380.1 Hypothetical protein, putative [Bodo saltans]
MERCLLLLIVALFVQPSTCRIVLPLQVSSIARSILSPCGVAMDTSGSLIVSSCERCAMYKISPSGMTLVVAGVMGSCGAANGIGTQARFSHPSGVTTDATHSFAFIADQDNNRIRMMDLSTFNVTTVTGSTSGSRDGAFSVAQFNQCTGLVYRSSAACDWSCFGLCSWADLGDGQHGAVRCGCCWGWRSDRLQLCGLRQIARSGGHAVRS